MYSALKNVIDKDIYQTCTTNDIHVALLNLSGLLSQISGMYSALKNVIDKDIYQTCTTNDIHVALLNLSVLKHQDGITTLHCIISQKSTDLNF
jgi:hypothetical protein